MKELLKKNTTNPTPTPGDLKKKSQFILTDIGVELYVKNCVIHNPHKKLHD